MKKLLTTTVLGLAMLLGSASLALAASAGTGAPADTTLPGYPGSQQSAPLTTGDLNDNNIGNADQTGKNVTDNTGAAVSDVIKSDGMNNKFAKDGTQVQVDGVTTQRTHGEYQNNTNSCASCHQTHTGAGDALIFKDTVYDTCTACHDGTLGFYNVFSASTAGTFGGTADGNASFHMAKGTLTASAAPGGNQSGTEPSSWGKSFNCASCHSPHGSYSDRLLNFNPNDVARTSYNEGGELVAGKVYTIPGTAVTYDDIAAALPTSSQPKFLTAVMTATQADLLSAQKIVGTKLADSNGTNGGEIKAGATMAGTDTVMVVLNWKDTTTATGHPDMKWVRDTAPWVNGHEYNETFHNKMDFVYLISNTYTGTADPANLVSGGMLIDGGYYLNPETVDSGDVKFVYGAKMPDPNDPTKKVLIRPTETATFTYSYNGAFAKVGTPSDFSTFNAYVARARVTKLSSATYPMQLIANFGGDATGNGGVQITRVNPLVYEKASNGIGVAISNYCAACHTDYFTKSTNPSEDPNGTGIWTKAFRHSTNSDNYTCLKCHFAHGTDVTVMMDAQDRDITKAATDLFAGDQVKAKAYLLDKNPTSALKRYTNQAVCWKCHTSSHSTNLMNNDYVYNVNTDTATNNNITSGYTAPLNANLPYPAVPAPTPVPTIP